MTQLLDLRVHGYAKQFTRRKLKNWYSLQISKQLDEGKPLHDIDDPLQFSLLKRIYTEWMVKLYNQMTAIPSKETGGQNSIGITDALNNEKDGLEYLDSFHDIDSMIEQSQEHETLWELCNLTVN